METRCINGLSLSLGGPGIGRACADFVILCAWAEFFVLH